MEENIADNTHPFASPETLWYLSFGGAVLSLTSKDASGDFGVGTGFHVGDGYLVTARHVVENRTEFSIESDSRYSASIQILREPLYHPNPKIDVAVVQTDFEDQLFR